MVRGDCASIRRSPSRSCALQVRTRLYRVSGPELHGPVAASGAPRPLPPLWGRETGSGCRYCNDTAIKPEAATALMRNAELEPWRYIQGPSAVEMPLPEMQAGRPSLLQHHPARQRRVPLVPQLGFQIRRGRPRLPRHPGRYGAAKIGITNRGSRLTQHRPRLAGPRTFAFRANRHSRSRRRSSTGGEVSWLCPFTPAQEMPQGGWTETVGSTEIDLAATIQRIRDLAVAPEL